MSVWTKPVYRDYPFQSVAKHLTKENLNHPFLLKLLDFDIDQVPGLKLKHGLQHGNVRRQVENREVNIINLIGTGPAAKDFDILCQEEEDAGVEEYLRNEEERQERTARQKEDIDRVNGLSQIQRRELRRAFDRKPDIVVEEPHLGLAGVYTFTARYYNILTSRMGQHFSQFERECFTSLTEAGLAASYLSARTAREYASNYADAIEGEFKGTQSFIRQIIKAAVWSGTRAAKNQRETNRFSTGEFPENPLSASLPGFATYSTFNLLIIVHRNDGETFLFTDVDIDRLRRPWNGLGAQGVYLNNYGLGSERDKRHAQLVESGKLLRQKLLLLMKGTNQKSPNRLCRILDIYYYNILTREATDINDTALILQKKKLEV